MHSKPVLAGISFMELSRLLSSYPSFRAKQVYSWICTGASSFNDMSNLPLTLRKELEDKFSLFPCALFSTLTDPDGTVKLGLDLEDGARIEAVILSDGEGRKTACLSTQAGCPSGCVFCKTGTLGFRRNLSAAEIAGQFLQLKIKEPEISHIVIMGMGEPLLNLENLRAAIDFIMDPAGLNISKRRITLSTCGIEKGIIDLCDNGPDIRLALSLTAAREELRKRLMPITQGNPLPLVKKALIQYQKKMKKRITLEMVLLSGINMEMHDAQALAEFAKGLDVVINLIPWNSVDGLEFEGKPLCPPSANEIAVFTAALESLDLKITRRFAKGQSVSGACGQLGVV